MAMILKWTIVSSPAFLPLPSIPIAFPQMTTAHSIVNNPIDRKSTMVHPDFQKRGFGSVLTLHVNEISDKSGDRVWVPARPTSVHIFKQLGFKDVGVVDAHLERWGGSAKKSKTWIVRRDSPSAAAA